MPILRFVKTIKTGYFGFKVIKKSLHQCWVKERHLVNSIVELETMISNWNESKFFPPSVAEYATHTSE